MLLRSLSKFKRVPVMSRMPSALPTVQLRAFCSDKPPKNDLDELRAQLKEEESKAGQSLQNSSNTRGEASTTDTESAEEPLFDPVEMVDGLPVSEMYVVKFNSPIIPFSKFPLHKNEYIREFLKRYTKDKPYVRRILGVHFEKNKNSNAEDAIGIEIQLTSSKSMHVVENRSFSRFKILSYDPKTNFCRAVPFHDNVPEPIRDKKKSDFLENFTRDEATMDEAMGKLPEEET